LFLYGWFFGSFVLVLNWITGSLRLVSLRYHFPRHYSHCCSFRLFAVCSLRSLFGSFFVLPVLVTLLPVGSGFTCVTVYVAHLRCCRYVDVPFCSVRFVRVRTFVRFFVVLFVVRFVLFFVPICHIVPFVLAPFLLNGRTDRRLGCSPDVGCCSCSWFRVGSRFVNVLPFGSLRSVRSRLRCVVRLFRSAPYVATVSPFVHRYVRLPVWLLCCCSTLFGSFGLVGYVLPVRSRLDTSVLVVVAVCSCYRLRSFVWLRLVLYVVVTRSVSFVPRWFTTATLFWFAFICLFVPGLDYVHLHRSLRMGLVARCVYHVYLYRYVFVAFVDTV